jgi:hypothetical protein
VWGYVCNLKTKKEKAVLKTCDFKISLDKSFVKKNQFIISSHILNETELLVLKGNSQVLEVHTVTYLNEDGNSAGTELKIEPENKPLNGAPIDKNGDVNMMGLEYDEVQQKMIKVEKGVLEGVDIDQLHGKVAKLFQPKKSKQIKTGSLVAVLEQSLHANDIESINWVLSNIDTHVISETVQKINKEALQSLMQNILIKLQQGVQKSSLLWLSIVLKLRWLDVIKFMNSKSTVHSSQSLNTLHTYLNRKTKNFTKYYEVRAKLQMVVESGQLMMSHSVDEENKELAEDEEMLHNTKFEREAVQVEDGSDSEDIDEVVEDVEAQDLPVAVDQESDESEVDIREDIEQYGDDVFDEENDDELEMDVDEEGEDDED